jgi:hypothetical protein
MGLRGSIGSRYNLRSKGIDVATGRSGKSNDAAGTLARQRSQGEGDSSQAER